MLSAFPEFVAAWNTRRRRALATLPKSINSARPTFLPLLSPRSSSQQPSFLNNRRIYLSCGFYTIWWVDALYIAFSHLPISRKLVLNVDKDTSSINSKSTRNTASWTQSQININTALIGNLLIYHCSFLVSSLLSPSLMQPIPRVLANALYRMERFTLPPVENDPKGNMNDARRHVSPYEILLASLKR